MITLSICIPTYNRCKFLMQNLEYFRENHSSEFEIVISDNGSNDSTKYEVQNFIKKYNLKNFNYSRNKTNIGPDANFKKVLSLANGRYALLLGDDDFLKDDFFESVIPFLKNNDLSFVSLASSEMIRKNANCSNRLFAQEQIDQFLLTLGPHITFMSIMIFNTKIVKKVLESAFDYEQNLYQSFLAIKVIQAYPKKEYAVLFYDPFSYNGVVSAENYDFYSVFIRKIIKLYKKALINYDYNYVLKIYGKSFKYYLFKFTIILKAIGIKKEIGMENIEILKKFPLYWGILYLIYNFPSSILSICYKIYKKGKNKWKLIKV